MHSFYEFFAGGGMARAGLGSDWQCLFANDISASKGHSYSANWGNEHLSVKDITTYKPKNFRQMPTWHGAHFHAKTFHWQAMVLGLQVNAQVHFGGFGS
jgi:site-specific DNA-cytosine methylase